MFFKSDNFIYLQIKLLLYYGDIFISSLIRRYGQIYIHYQTNLSFQYQSIFFNFVVEILGNGAIAVLGLVLWEGAKIGWNINRYKKVVILAFACLP